MQVRRTYLPKYSRNITDNEPSKGRLKVELMQKGGATM